MRIEIIKTSPDWLPNEAAAMTTHGKEVNASMKSWCKSEHSPLRCERFWIKMYGIPTFVSVHFARHKFGVDHYVQSNRDDRDGDTEVDRDTPVNHGMDINSQSLISMARRRLCHKSHSKTVAVMRKIKKALASHAVADFLVPECVYRNGFCPEFSECKPGLEKVMRAYGRIK